MAKLLNLDFSKKYWFFFIKDTLNSVEILLNLSIVFKFEYSI